MKVLTSLQPWAELLVRGAKTIETRDWTTPHRGLLLIHASKRRGHPAFDQLPRGFIIGAVILERIAHRDVELVDPNRFAGLEDGCFYWHVRPCVRLKDPIPAQGHPKLWDYHHEALEAEIRKVVR